MNKKGGKQFHQERWETESKREWLILAVYCVGLLFVVLVTAAVLTGCSKKRGTAANKASAGAGKHEALTMVTGSANYSTFLDALKEKYPEINIDVISYRGGNSSGYFKKTLETGDIPDIYTATYYDQEELQRERLLDLSTYDFVNDYMDTMLDEVDNDGGIYLLPSRYTIYGINYNKTMFEKYGWEVPNSFEDLKKLAAQIDKDTDGSVTPVVAEMTLGGHPFNWFFSLNSTGFFGTPDGEKWKNDFLEGETTAKGNIEECAEYFKEWVDAGFITDEDAVKKDAATRFYNQKAAMILTLNSNLYTYKEQYGIDFELGLMPWLSKDGKSNMLTTQVSRYYGLNKELAEPGNEQKLEDALKVMSFMSSEEGQLALVNNDKTGLMFPIKGSGVDKDSPLYGIRDLVAQGYTAPLVYNGWEQHLIYPMYDELLSLVRGQITTDQFVGNLDTINQKLQENPESDVIAVADERLTKEQAARLSGMAMIDYLDVDAAFVSLGGIEDNCYENARGANAPVYEGDITQENITIFAPSGTNMVTVKMTGAQMKELAKTGRLFQIQPGSYREKPDETEVVEFTLPYVMTVKNDAELEDDKTYTVAFNAKDYNDNLAEEWGDKLTNIEDKTVVMAVTAWIEALDDNHLNAEKLKWKN